MHCLKCGASWISGNCNPIIAACPVCDTDFKQEAEYRGYDSVLELLLCLIYEEGDEVCRNTLKITSFLNDYFPQETFVRAQIGLLLNEDLGNIVYQLRKNLKGNLDIKKTVERAGVTYPLTKIEQAVYYLAERITEYPSPVNTADFFLKQVPQLKNDVFRISALEKANEIEPQIRSLRQLSELLFSVGKSWEAINSLEKAANLGDEDAFLLLSEIFELGKEVPINYSRSVFYLNQLEKNGNTKAYYQLGRFYYLGLGVEKDVERAVKYFLSAAEKDHEEALYMLYRLMYRENKTRAVEYLRRSAAQGYVPAMYDYSLHLLYGDDIKKNVHEAILLMENCAALKYQDALSKLRYLYTVGYEVEANKEKAKKYRKTQGEL